MKNVMEQEKSIRYLGMELMEAGNILVLNASYEPINITSWRRALVLLMKEKAQIVSKGIIRLKEYIKINFNRFIATRRMIHERDNHQCIYCGSYSNLSIDHVIPKSRGGEESWTNLATACMPCNYKKGNRTPEEAGMRMRYKPGRPRSKVDLQIIRSNNSAWKEYSYS